MFGLVDRWARNGSGIVLVGVDGEAWLNCSPELLKTMIERGLKVGDEVYYELSDRYKKRIIKLWFRKDYEEQLKRVNEDQLPKEVVPVDSSSREEDERLYKLLERIAVALEYQNKIYRGN